MDTVYLDNAATTFPKPKEVYEYMDYMYRNYGINMGRGKYNSENNISKIVADTRDMVKDLVKAKENYETVFTSSATIALNQILLGLEYKNIKNIYISYFEHNAVIRTLEKIKNKYDINIHFLDFNKDEWQYNFDKIEYDFKNNKPDLVIVNHISNVFGYISPIKEIGDISKKYGSLYLVDGSQSVGLEEIDINYCNVDFLVFAGHKTLYGPFGIAGFLMKKNIKLEPFIYGGTGIDSANINMPEDGPTRYEAGSMNIMALFGLYKSLNWMKDLTINNIRDRKNKLTKMLIECLNKYDFIEMYLPEKNHTSVISFKVKNYPVDTIGDIISNKYNISLRTGLHCAPNAHKLIGTFPEGTIRLSVGYFNTEEDIEKLDFALSEIEYEI